MALLDTNPVLVRDVSYRYSERYSWVTGVLASYWTRSERVYEWPCDLTGGETTHEGTYATGDYTLQEYGIQNVDKITQTGVWVEIYRTPGAKTAIP